MDDRIGPPTDGFRRFAWFQTLLGPIYFLVWVLVVERHRPGRLLEGAVTACVLSCLGLLMLYRLRRRG